MANLNPNLKHYIDSTDANSRIVADYVGSIKKGDRVALSQAITLLESTRRDHKDKAHAILNRCLPDAGDSIRVGITGVPGVGKSTFIEALGTRLIEHGHRLAVLAIDPTSSRTKGSILGDKTRMGALSRSDDVFIRPSPTGGSLGGVARTTRETILLCEAAGFDTVFVETVGVGQSETAVHSMVDFFLLLALARAGDELQGIKRGIMEMADAIAINKADGDNRKAAEQARQTYENALHLFPPDASGWTPPVRTCSAQTGDGVDDVWNVVEGYVQSARETGLFTQKRQRQAKHWMYETIEQQLHDDFFNHPDVQAAQDEVERHVLAGALSSFAAAQRLLDIYHDAG